MSSTKEFRSADELHSEIIATAATDSEFRAALLADPKSSIAEEFGVNLPGMFNITVHESQGTVLHLALPPDLQELSEEQLEAIAAGDCGQWVQI